MATFVKATRKQARLRMALVGPAGSGKTYSALAVGTALGSKIALVDTEHGSAAKYAGLFEFDTLELNNFHPSQFIDALKSAEDAGYDVVIIDSLSHAWMGKGGALELVDNAAARSKSGNSFTAWKEVTPLHNQLMEAILQSKCHVLATMRAKTEYSMEKDERTGRTVPRKIGLAPVQRDGVEFEFDVVGDLDQQNRFVITKTRCPSLAEQVIDKPGKQLAATLKAWLSDGAPVPAAAKQSHAPAPQQSAAPVAAPAGNAANPLEQCRNALKAYAKKKGMPAASAKLQELAGVAKVDMVPADKLPALLAALQQEVA